MIQVYRGGTNAFDLFITSSGVATDLDALPDVSILDPSLAEVDTGTGTHVDLGHYRFSYSVDDNATLGVWEIDWDGLLGALPVSSTEQFQVLGALAAFSGTGPCQPWATADDVADCPKCDGLDDEAVAWGIDVASYVLYELSGRQWSGLCSLSARPCGSGVGCAPSILQASYRGCRDHGYASCGCGTFCEVNLGVGPISSIVSIDVAGEDLTSVAVVVDGHWLARTDGECWPTAQNLLAPEGDPDTFTVNLTYGLTPPVAGVRAAAALACEIAKSCSGGACALPERVTSVTRQGISMAVLDPLDFLDHGRTGLYLVDLFLKSANPDGVRGPTTIASPDYNRPTRRVTWP